MPRETAPRTPAIERCEPAEVGPLGQIRFAENDRARFAQPADDRRIPGTLLLTSASDPAVVCMLSPVAMLSFTRIGMPWSGPRT